MAQQQVAERKVARQVVQVEARNARDLPWRFAFFGLLGALLLGLLAWPGVPVNWKMYAAVHGVCAQIHNVTLAGMQLPICARNTGIYSSFLITSLYLIALGRGRAARIPPWPIAGVLLLFVVIMAIDGFNSLFVDLFWPHLYTPRNELRTLTGLGMGISIAVMIVLMLNLALRRSPDTDQPVIASWVELAGAVLLNLLVMAALYGNVAFMYWPLAIIAWLGIIGVLYCVNVLVVAVLLRYEGSVVRLAELARPATVALLLTVVQLAALGAARFWLEGQGMMLG